jgi:hypothetical protein
MQRNNTPLNWLKLQLETVQDSIIRFLERKEKALSQGQKKIYFFLFVFSFGGFFLFCLVSGLAGYGTPGFSVSPIKRPIVKHQAIKQDSVKIK